MHVKNASVTDKSNFGAIFIMRHGERIAGSGGENFKASASASAPT